MGWYEDLMSGTVGDVLDPGNIFTGELKRKKEMDKYQGTIEGLAGEYSQAAEEAAKALEALANGLDPSQLTPYQYSVLQDFHPEIAQYVSEQAPQLMNQGGVGRDLMMEQAQNARSMYSEGDSPAARAARELQLMDSSKLQQQLLSQLQAKTAQEGHGNANTDLMLALGVGQQAQDALYKQQLQSQSQGDQNRLQALQMMGSAGANLQSNDQNAQRSNVDIMNSYNQRLARNKWDYNKYQADTQNEANMYNIGQRQGAADKNVLSKNQAVVNNQQAKTDLQQKAIQARLGGKQGGITSRGQVAAERAGFDTGSASRQQGDTQQGINIAGTIASIFGKKG
jgi:hypothetical protein